MNLQKLTSVLNEYGYKTVLRNEYTIAINGKEVKIIGNLVVTNGQECPFGSPKDLLMALWSAGIINDPKEAVNIADKYNN